MIRIGPFVLCAVMAACGGAPPRGEGALPDYPGELGPVSALGDDFVMRQRVTFTRGDQSHAMDVAAEKHGDELRVLGLTPMGSRAYYLRQTGATLAEVQLFMPGTPTVPPRFVLLDFHRVLGAVFTEPAPADGVRSTVVHDERVEETWRGGLLLRRTFTRVDGHPAGALVVDYGAGMGDAPPAEIHLQNPWLGYGLTITTTLFTRGSPGTATPSGS